MKVEYRLHVEMCVTSIRQRSVKGEFVGQCRGGCQGVSGSVQVHVCWGCCDCLLP